MTPPVSDRVPDGGPDRGPDGVLDGVLDGVSDRGPDGVSDRGPDGVSDGGPDGVSDGGPDIPRRGLVLRGALALSVLVQVLVLYAPQGTGAPLFPHADKLGHLVVFVVPVLLGRAAGLRPVALAAALGAHGVVSEVVQATLLPGRSGDALDALADLAGVALGLLLWRWRGRPQGGGWSGRAGARW